MAAPRSGTLGRIWAKACAPPRVFGKTGGFPADFRAECCRDGRVRTAQCTWRGEIGAKTGLWRENEARRFLPHLGGRRPLGEGARFPWTVRLLMCGTRKSRKPLCSPRHCRGSRWTTRGTSSSSSSSSLLLVRLVSAETAWFEVGPGLTC